MKKIYSLTSKIEFNSIIKKGEKIKEKHILVLFKRDNNFKMGISIPKKLGNSVFRNKQKRIIKNIISIINSYQSNTHTILIIRNSFTNLPFEKKYIILSRIIDKLNEKQ